MAQKYRIGESEFAADDQGFPAALATAYSKKERVLCLCRKGVELPLYISHRFDKHVLSRWPGSGARHATSCDHYEAPDFLTGMGQIKGAAVQDNEENGETTLKVDFPLSRGAARKAPSALTNDKATIKTTGNKLTLRGFLHFLWDRAQLTHWHPKMQDKRSWFVVRRALLDAAGVCKVKMEAMGDVLFVPEAFRMDDKEGIASRRYSALERVWRSPDELMIVVAEVKEVNASHGSSMITLAQVGRSLVLMLDKDMTRRFDKRFNAELSLWRLNEKCGGHLVMAGTFNRRTEGVFDLIEVALMPVTKEWIPYESDDEFNLIDQAVKEQRRFVKGMRVNLDREVQIASMVLKDTGDRATAVYVHNPLVKASEPLIQLMASDAVEHLCWCNGGSFPRKGPRRREAAAVVDEGTQEVAAALSGPERGGVLSLIVAGNEGS